MRLETEDRVRPPTPNLRAASCVNPFALHWRQRIKADAGRKESGSANAGRKESGSAWGALGTTLGCSPSPPFS